MMLAAFRRWGAILALLAALGGPAVYFGAQPGTFSDVAGIEAAEDSYFKEQGKYLQVLPGNLPPHYEVGSTESKLGKKLPANYRVDVYEAPEGPGYQVTYEDAATIVSAGEGPEAAARSFIYAKPAAGVKVPSGSGPLRTLNLRNPFPDLVAWLLPKAQAAYGLTQSANFVSASSQSLSRATNLSIATNITMEAWIRVASAPTSGNAKAIMGVRGNTNKNVYGLEYANNAGTLQFQVRVNQDNVTSNTYVFTQTFTVGTWYHVAMTNDGTTVKGYVDGVERISTGYPGAGSGAPPQNFTIGDHPWGEVGKWDGDISLARVWDTALAAATILANKCTVYGTATTNMRGEWSLDNVLTDASGNAYTLTNNNVVTFTSNVPAVCQVVAAPPQNVGIIFFN